MSTSHLKKVAATFAAIGTRHKTAREEVLKMSVAEYSKRMRVSAVSVYAWESGTRSIPHEVLHALEVQHGISTSWIHNGTEPMLIHHAAKSGKRNTHEQEADTTSALEQLQAIHEYLQRAGKAISTLSREVLVVNPLRKITTRFPLMASSVSAGSPVSTSDDTVTVDIVDFLVSNPDHTFFVNVVGDSMKDIGIYDGDTLIIDRSIIPKSGEIIVARVFNELTVKRFVRNGKRVILAAENKAHKNIEVTEDMDFSIIGVVTTSIKKFRR
jgi:DNA polymerase V